MAAAAVEVAEAAGKAAARVAIYQAKTAAGEWLCFADNKGEVCVHNPCTFKHACPICEGLH